MIIVDAYSKWPEVIPMSSTTTHATMSALMPIFATHGLPERVVTDNGTQFCSEEFANFLKSNGISHTRSAPYHPSTNGEAERFVQTFKHNMKCRGATQNNVVSNISKFLLQYRATEHASTGQSPSNLLMGRRIRTKMDLVVPSFRSEQVNRGWNQMENPERVRHFKERDKVMVRVYNSDDKWKQGIIKNKIGDLNYDVEVDGTVHRRHVNQLRGGSVSNDVEPTSQGQIRQNVESADSNESSMNARSPSTRLNKGIPPGRLDL